jgi:predicted Zn-dependent protease
MWVPGVSEEILKPSELYIAEKEEGRTVGQTAKESKGTMDRIDGYLLINRSDCHTLINPSLTAHLLFL